ncbi:MAG: S8 family serine peptidase [Candidatus Promineifilaceae bacterium]|nr:S8 family serine peptidase [Candidatus Promineifilaceae bacterium]
MESYGEISLLPETSSSTVNNQTRTRATGPSSDQRRLHTVVARFPLIRKRVTVTKVWNPAEDRVDQTAVDSQGRQVDLDQLRRQEMRAYVARYKKLHPALYEEVRRAPANRSVPIALWVYVSEDFIDKNRYLHRSDEPPLLASAPSPGTPPPPLLAYRQRIRRAVEEVEQKITQELGLRVSGRLQIAPVLHLEATRQQLDALARLPEITNIYLYEPQGIDDLNSSLSVSKANSVLNTMGYRGSDIRVGIWEEGPDDISKLRIEEHFDAARARKSSHARLVTAIIKNRQGAAPRGYAPDAKIYSANRYTLDALEWAVKDKRCSVINQSFHRRSEAQNGTLSLDDVVKDYLAVHYPFPTIVQAAGNLGGDGVSPRANEYVNHKGYNSLSIANHNDTASSISASSARRNPPTTHKDRELPELSANGVAVSAVGLSMSGTSFASPAVAGTVALIQNANNRLIYWPEGCRAILLAAAGKNISGRTWWEDVRAKTDGADGAGALNAQEAVRIARSYKLPNSTASLRGWYVGTYSDGSFGANGFSRDEFKVQIPDRRRGRRKVKIALTWNSAPVYTRFNLFGASHRVAVSLLSMDLDLIIYDRRTPVAHSLSFDNSYEIAEFSGQPGKTYTIKVRRNSGSGHSYYGLAWTVHP